jgi:hypothetical protein
MVKVETSSLTVTDAMYVSGGREDGAKTRGVP